jgi:hypothetical protein
MMCNKDARPQNKIIAWPCKYGEQFVFNFKVADLEFLEIL